MRIGHGNLPEGRCDLANLERIPGVLPFEIYAQAPLRLVSWCSFELTQAARRLLRDLAILCEDPRTTIQNWWTRLPCETHRSRQTRRYTVQSRSLSGAMFILVFLDPVLGAMMKQARRQTLKSLAAECLVSVRLGLLNS